MPVHPDAHSARPASSLNAAVPERVFPIVGVGASAGGLEALEQFFAATPVNSGIAYVVIQHLAPDRQGMLPEILQRTTAMPVKQATDRMSVVPDNVYVIPPNQDISLRHDKLYLLPPLEAHGLRLPIDSFLRSLAVERRELGIGVILSGMGSDGTLGLQAIKEQGGLSLVQEPASAKFDAMPRSAINAGLADIIAAAQELPARIDAFLKRAPAFFAASTNPESNAKNSAFEQACILLRMRTGHDFSLYKKSTMYRRIERRMGIHQLSKIADYVRFLQANLQEIDLLFKELLIGVTHFFRDPAAWAFLQEETLPALIAAQPDGAILRAWVAGCSSGEEAYSLAIAFREVVQRSPEPGRVTLQIFATDLDADAIAVARHGLYPANIAADVSDERLSRFFSADGDGYRVNKVIREKVIFAPQNVIMDPPFTKLDILTCRNLLIYLGPELQKKLLPLFHYSLKPGGILFLGSAENLGGFGELFTPVESKARLFRREPGPLRVADVDFPTRRIAHADHPGEAHVPLAPPFNLQALAEQLLVTKYSPSAVLINGAGDVLFISGHTGKYLEPAAGKANWNIHVMARGSLRNELAIALPEALRSGEEVIVRNLKIGLESNPQFIDLSVFPLCDPNPLRGMILLAFTEAAPPHTARSGRDAAFIELEHTLQQAAKENRRIREEMQNAHEALRSANKELQSTNEEMQSNNEELTTAKEEMQSLNEELQTVNAELQSKVDELSSTSNDMNNLLNSTAIATVFLDPLLHIRRFTAQTTRIFKLIPGDLGRPLSDIVSSLDYPQLQEDAREVLRTLVFSEKQVTGGKTHWYLVRIMPYRTLENVIDGVVITFIDISEAKHLEAELRKVREDAGMRPLGGKERV